MPSEYEGFEWDENKYLTNLRKHGIDFREATEIFAGEWQCLPARAENDEKRFMAIGIIYGLIVTLIYTERERARKCRIISARHASKYEQKIYELFIARSNTNPPQ